MMLTARQEAFALNLFKGLTQREAWIQAGYSNKYPVASIDSNACQLAEKTKIKQRLQELRNQAASDAIMSEREAKERLSDIARANLVDFQRDGEPVLSKDVPHHAAASEYYHRTRFDKAGNPIITKSIKLLNPISAIKTLAEMEKWLDIPYQDNRQLIFIIGKGYRPKELPAPSVSEDIEGEVKEIDDNSD